MKSIKDIVLRNRYTLLLTVLATYVLVLVIEGAITGREARFVDFENPFFDLNVDNLDGFREERREERREGRREEQSLPQPDDL